MCFKERMVYRFEYMNVCLVTALACWVFQFLGWASSGHVRFKDTRLNVHLKEHQNISQKLWEIVFFHLVGSLKFVFCRWKTPSSVFSTFRESLFTLSHIESFHRLWFIHFAHVSCEHSVRVKLISSAKWYALEYFKHEWRLSM